MKIELNDGFVCEVNKENLDDMELVDKIAAADSGDVLAVSFVVDKLLGSETKSKLYNHLREKGRVPIEKVSETIIEIMTKMGEDGKN
ncbi:hypothetical protein SAMN02910327_00423 [Peptostreptococcaceae bacterium pGA-8]|nr:hypothetical protein SAMN02910327_00423 [Peptostreptococcaceae bacterium pGA-8]